MSALPSLFSTSPNFAFASSGLYASGSFVVQANDYMESQPASFPQPPEALSPANATGLKSLGMPAAPSGGAGPTGPRTTSKGAAKPAHISRPGAAPGSGGGHRSPYTYCGPNADSHRSKRLHHDFKSLSKVERQRLVEQEAADSDLLARTVHLRFLPTSMKQSDLAAVCSSCGEYLRVRICGNSTNNQNWIYGFVEFATKEGADNMMQKSGMELPNGPGRPPLRLKCNSAKQPIVDRVFHDADPSTSTPCIFGLGNFSNRSLKDALDSYFNLKVKEAQQQQQQLQLPPPPQQQQHPSRPKEEKEKTDVKSGPVDPATQAGSTRREFQPNPSAAAFLPRTYAAERESPDTQSNLSDSITGMTPPHHQTGFASGSSATSPHMGGVLPDYMNRILTTSSAEVFFDQSSNGQAVGYTGFCDFPPPAVDLLGSVVPAFNAPQSLSEGLLFPSAALGATTMATPAATTSATSAASPTTMDAGSLFSLSLQDMIANGSSITSGFEILERGRALVLKALEFDASGPASSRSFYDALGTLSSLLKLLDRHTTLTGGPANTGAGEANAEIPQRVTQLRLLAHLMLALLFMLQRNLSDALPHLFEIAACCNLIPNTPVVDPCTVQQRSDLAASVMVPSGPALNLTDLAVGAAVSSEAEAVPQSRFPDFFRSDYHSIFTSILDTLPDSYPENEVTAEADATAQAVYSRDVDFHSYTLNVLVTVGLAMEELKPAVARRAYALASRRASEVLNVSWGALEACLAEPDEEVPPRLSDVVLSRMNVNPQATRDITTFPRLFFESIALHRPLLQQGSQFWSFLPPYHCVRCFPVNLP